MLKLKDNMEFIKQFCEDEDTIKFYFSLFKDNKIIKPKNLENFINYLTDNMYEKEICDSSKLFKLNSEKSSLKFLNRENDDLVLSIILNVLFRNISLKYIEMFMRNYDGDLEKLIEYINGRIHSTKEMIFLQYPRILRLELIEKIKNEKLKEKIKSVMDLEEPETIPLTMECQNCICEEDKKSIFICNQYHTFCDSCFFMSNQTNGKCLNLNCKEKLFPAKYY